MNWDWFRPLTKIIPPQVFILTLSRLLCKCQISVLRHCLTNFKKGLSRAFLTRHQLQSLLGKLSLITACIKPGRTFMFRLFNILWTFPFNITRLPISSDMRYNIQWWLDFLPSFNGISIINPTKWDFDDLCFTTDTCLEAGRYDRFTS